VLWLGEHNPTIPEDIVAESAEDALLSLIRNPGSFQPEKGDLEPFLRMSAQGDLRNRLRKEARHRSGRESLESVELSDPDGKYLGRSDDPSLPLQIEEELLDRQRRVPPEVRDGLTGPESRVLDLMLLGERRTPAYAEILGIADRPAEEQRRTVKQVKDMLQKRIVRARGTDEQEP
jgi:DNA-directed RNA polymerase specialized sigma24 family protein